MWQPPSQGAAAASGVADTHMHIGDAADACDLFPPDLEESACSFSTKDAKHRLTVVFQADDVDEAGNKHMILSSDKSMPDDQTHSWLRQEAQQKHMTRWQSVLEDTAKAKRKELGLLPSEKHAAAGGAAGSAAGGAAKGGAAEDRAAEDRADGDRDSIYSRIYGKIQPLFPDLDRNLLMFKQPREFQQLLRQTKDQLRHPALLVRYWPRTDQNGQVLPFGMGFGYKQALPREHDKSCQDGCTNKPVWCIEWTHLEDADGHEVAPALTQYFCDRCYVAARDMFGWIGHRHASSGKQLTLSDRQLNAMCNRHMGMKK